ncbi:MAG TPA: Rpn family recombination-promoting nuclease/putative transposase [Methanospirillum sp.]|nr:Rpn family recombination-promoting nuclease/putative transposase [Methanospirillum sp.]
MFKDFDDMRSEYRMKEVKHLREYNGDLRLVFYELPKYTKKVEELETLEDKWLYFVKEAGSLEFKPVSLTSIPEIGHDLDIANEAGLPCHELEMQHKRRDFIILQRGSIAKAKQDGLKEGEIKGRVEIISHMKAMGIAIDEIKRLTGLSDDEIDTIVQNKRNKLCS